MATIQIKFPESETPALLNLHGSRITIGRLPHNTIQIMDRSISALHAELIKEGDHYRLHDRGSSNGTFVNGEQVTDFHLREAVRIGFGTVECEFFPASAPAESEQPAEPLPTRGEINEVRQENVKLRNQVELLREEAETLRKGAASVAGEAAETVIIPKEEFVRMAGEIGKGKESLLHAQEEAKRLRDELAVTRRDRDNLQRALNDGKTGMDKNRVVPMQGEAAQAAPAGKAEMPPSVMGAADAAQETPAPASPAPAAGGAVNPAMIRPFPKGNPPAAQSKPGFPEPRKIDTGAASAGQQAPAPLPKPFAKSLPKVPAPAGPKGTQKITASEP